MFSGVLFQIFRFAPLGVALALLAMVAVAPEWVQGLADRLAPDSRAASFPLDRIERIQDRLGTLAALWLGIGAAFAAPRLRVAERALECLGAAGGTLRSAGRSLRAFVRDEPVEAAAVGVLTFLFAGLAALLVTQPMRCDEAGTLFEFIRKPWYFIVTTYESANNHILHNLCAHATSWVFGDRTWAVRLPSYVAGVLAVPAGYAAVRIHFCKRTALLAATMIASWLWLVDLATTARGYAMLNLFFLLLLVLAPRLLGGGKGPWTLFVLLCAAGTWTVPVMVYPLAIVFLWLAWSGWAELPRDEAMRFLAKLVGAGAAYVALGLVLYSWTFVTSGTENVVMAKWVRPRVPPSYLDLLGSLADLIRRLWSHWSFGVPSGLGFFALTCVGMAVVFYQPPGARGHRLLLSGIAGTVVIVLALGRVPFFWTSPHLALLFLIAAAAGFVTLLRVIPQMSPRVEGALVIAAMIALIGLNTRVVLATRGQMEVPWYVGYHEAPLAAAHLAEGYDGTPITGVAVHLHPLRYYLHRAGIDDAPLVFDPEHFEGDALYFIEAPDPDFENTRRDLADLGFTDEDVVATFPRSRLLLLKRE